MRAQTTSKREDSKNEKMSGSKEHCMASLYDRLQLQSIKGLFTWREEDPSARKILEGGTTFRLLYMQNFGRSGYQEEKEKKNNCRSLAAELLAAAMFVLSVLTTRIFRANVVYMVLGSLSLEDSISRKILALGLSTTFCM